MFVFLVQIRERKMERESSEGMVGWWKTAALGSTTYKTTCCYTQNTERDKNYDNTYCLTSHLWEKKTNMTNILMEMGTKIRGLFVPHNWQKPDNMKHKPKEPSAAQGGLVLNQCMTKDRKLRKTSINRCAWHIVPCSIIESWREDHIWQAVPHIGFQYHQCHFSNATKNGFLCHQCHGMPLS